jgi:hypothetical protein
MSNNTDKKIAIFLVNGIMFWEYKESILAVDKISSIELIPGCGLNFMMSNTSRIHWQGFFIEDFKKAVEDSKDFLLDHNKDNLGNLFSDIQCVLDDSDKEVLENPEQMKPLKQEEYNKEESISSSQVFYTEANHKKS